jgi:hypothetical protein
MRFSRVALILLTISLPLFGDEYWEPVVSLLAPHIHRIQRVHVVDSQGNIQPIPRKDRLYSLGLRRVLTLHLPSLSSLDMGTENDLQYIHRLYRVFLIH